MPRIKCALFTGGTRDHKHVSHFVNYQRRGCSLLTYPNTENVYLNVTNSTRNFILIIESAVDVRWIVMSHRALRMWACVHATLTLIPKWTSLVIICISWTGRDDAPFRLCLASFEYTTHTCTGAHSLIYTLITDLI